MIVATAGHVDHGKTTLVKALTGVDTDRLPEEKARGMSIDIGFAYLRDAPRSPIAFVDVPGHERFVRNMIAGVHAVDGALLVVAADDGPMPQTREHLRILELLGAPRLAVVLTKTDRVDAPRIAQAQREVHELLAASRYADAPVLPVVAPAGLGLDALRELLHAWQDDTPARDPSGAFRMHVDRAFVLQGLGLVVTGAVVAGRIAVGEEVIVARDQRTARVRNLRANDTEALAATAGERCALNLAGIARGEIERGDVLLGLPGIGTTRRIEALLEPAGDSAPRPGQAVMVCIGAQAVRGTVTPVEREVGDGHAVAYHARIALAAAVSAFHGDPVLLRDAGSDVLVAGGRVLDPWPPERGPARRRQPDRLRALARHLPSARGSDLEARGQSLLGELLAIGDGLVDVDALARTLGVAPARIERWLDAVHGVVIETQPTRWAVSLAVVQAIEREVSTRVDAWHAEHPDRMGLPIATLREDLRERAAALVRASIRRLRAAGELAPSGPYLRRPAHRPVLAANDRIEWERIAPLLDVGDDRPPRVLELAERLGKPAVDVVALLERAVHAGLAYRVAPNRFFLPRTVAALARLACTLAAEGERATFTARAFRDRSNLGRNLSIEVLEFLDSVGLTRRVGNERCIVGTPDDLLMQ